MVNFTKKSVNFLFKKKPFLADLIPDGYTDIHSHLLPGIDDGAKTIDDTVFLISELKKIGCSSLITTPHTMQNVWDNTAASITATLEKTVAGLAGTLADLPLRAASEYLLDGNFSQLFEKGEILCLKDNLVLVEMSYINPPIQLYQIIFELQVAGYVPVLAHPERYSFYHKNFAEFKKLKNAGCLFQLNLLSVIGYYGKPVADTALALLKTGMIDFTGSDVHHKNHIAGFYKRILVKDEKPLREALSQNGFFGF